MVSKTVFKISALIVCLAFLSVGCGTARIIDRKSERMFRDGEYIQLAQRLEKKHKEKENEEGRNQLLYLMNIGLAYHSAGEYKKSNVYLLKADKVAEIKDYTSIATEAGALLTSTAIRDYKGEDFENVMISTYLAINFTLLGMFEDALVEARRVNRKLYLMVTEGKRKYRQNGFATFLAGMLYESQREWEDAYIDYKKTFKLLPDNRQLGKSLWRMAWKGGRPYEAKKWKDRFALTDAEIASCKKLYTSNKFGELVVLYQNGISPRKVDNPRFRTIPIFWPRRNPVHSARVFIDGREIGDTEIYYDIEQVAIQNLDEKYAGIIAQKIAGMVVKEVVAYQIEKSTKSPTIGFLARLFFYASDQADLRSWRLLPKDLQVLRMTIPVGKHKIKIEPLGDKDKTQEYSVTIRPKKISFLNVRYTPYY